jgi:hypothetical protein
VNETFAAPAGFRRQYYLGQWLDVKDTVNQWLEATVMRIDNVARRIFVHYNGWYSQHVNGLKPFTTLLIYIHFIVLQAGSMGRVDRLRLSEALPVPHPQRTRRRVLVSYAQYHCFTGPIHG